MNSQKNFRPSEKLMHGALVGTGFALAVLAVSAAYAALNYSVPVGTMSSGSTLSSTEWNKMVSNFSTIDAQLSAVSTASMPTGAVVAFFGTSCPTGWSAADGTAGGVKKTDGSAGTLDLRGEFVRGLDTAWVWARGVDTGRTIATAQSHAVQNGSTIATTGWAYNYSAGTWSSPSIGEDVRTGQKVAWSGNSATETRPRNVALLYCVKN